MNMKSWDEIKTGIGLKKSDRYGEAIDDAYDESDRTMMVGDAHRDRIYELPSPILQMFYCSYVQMKMFTKQKTVYLMLFLLALIPIIFFIVRTSVEPDPFASMGNINEFLATLLILMPVMGVIISCIICGSMLPQEFGERTVYLSLPLPMPRYAFYFGKFISGLLLVIGIITAAYGIPILIAMTYTTTGYTGEIFKSLGLCLCGVFFTCAFAYMLSARSKRGSSMKPFLATFVGIPGLALVLNYVAMKTGVSALHSIASYFPTSAIDLGLAHLGTTFNNMPHIGFWNLLNSTPLGSICDISIGTNDLIMGAVAVVLGVLCLIAGMIIVDRRDM